MLKWLCSVWLQVGSTTPNFDAMAGNPLAKQIPWDTNPAYLAAWKAGRTGAARCDALPQLQVDWMRVSTCYLASFSGVPVWPVLRCPGEKAPTCMLVASSPTTLLRSMINRK